MVWKNAKTTAKKRMRSLGNQVAEVENDVDNFSSLSLSTNVSHDRKSLEKNFIAIFPNWKSQAESSTKGLERKKANIVNTDKFLPNSLLFGRSNSNKKIS